MDRKIIELSFAEHDNDSSLSLNTHLPDDGAEQKM